MKQNEGADNACLDSEEVQPKRPKGQKIFSFIFRFAVSVVLLVWIFKSVDLSIFSEIIVSPSLLPITAMVVFSVFYVFLGGLKLWVLFRGFSPMSLPLFTGYFFLAGSVGSRPGNFRRFYDGRSRKTESGTGSQERFRNSYG